MKETIIDYVKEYGNYTFTERGMNDVDSLVLCQLSYLKFDDMVPLVTENQPFVSIKDLVAHPLYERLYSDERFAKENRALFENVCNSKRYENLRMNCYINLIIEQEDFQTQFSAITFLLGDGTLFLAYRGTDETIIGWKEDLNMTFVHPVPGQAYSAKYLNMVASKVRTKVCIGGHSKGGNFAVYAAMKCLPQVQEKIDKIFCLDGPGFMPSVLKECDYEKIRDRVIRILPHSSLVGRLLVCDDHYKIVKSKRFGIMQHDPFNWITKEGSFVELPKINHQSEVWNESLNQWIYSQDREQLRRMVDTLFEIVSAAKTDNLIDLEANWKEARTTMLSALKELNEEDSEMMKKMIQGLYALIIDNWKKDISDTLKKAMFWKSGQENKGDKDE